jgi:hypothetical protein
MARTRTAGIQTDAEGCKVVDKRAFGVRIKRRIGKLDQDQAEAWLAREVEKLRQAKLFGRRSQRTFREAAIRYLEENAELACIDEVAWHLKLLDPYIGKLGLPEVPHEASRSRSELRFGYAAISAHAAYQTPPKFEFSLLHHPVHFESSRVFRSSDLDR